MATRSQIYDAKAQECERLAQSALDPDMKRKLLELAAAWRQTSAEESNQTTQYPLPRGGTRQG
jgi:hypothetical protein